MRFFETPLAGAYVVWIEQAEDERGFFARTWCRDELAEQGLNPDLAQCSISYNRNKGTLRGLHYQLAPNAETKLVRCTQGAIYDVIVDLRADSLTYRRWFGLELSADNRASLYIPEQFAHGFQTLVDDSEVLYYISATFAPESTRGVGWDDPAFSITWPLPVSIISERDQTFPRLKP